MTAPTQPPTQPPTATPIRCVCFDWGGVILAHCRSWGEACAAAGLPLREGWDAPERVTKRRALNARFQRGQIEPDAFFAAIEAANDGLYTALETRTLHDAWLTGEYPGIAEVIRRLALVPDVETALLSNTNSEHWLRHIAAEGRDADFPTVALLKHRHASHLLGAAKPDEAIYRAFERETGFRGPEVLFFDDLTENIAAAERCGWRGALIDHTGDTARQVEWALTSRGVFR